MLGKINFSSKLATLPRQIKQLVLIVDDVFLLLISVYLAYVLRYGFLMVPNFNQAALMLAAPVVALPIYVHYGLYRSVIRYLPERVIWTILQASAISALLWVSLVFLAEMSGGSGVPRSVPLIYWLLSTAFITMSRFSAKWLLYHGAGALSKNTALIIGTGEPAQQLAAALSVHSDTYVVGFIDNDKTLTSMDVGGIRVYDSSRIETLTLNYGVKQIIFSDPALTEAERRAYAMIISRLNVDSSILPPIADLSRGKYLVSSLRNIGIDDLLGRSPVPPDEDMLLDMVAGRSIMVTGAGGSIGSELCLTLLNWQPNRLILFEISEFSLYQLERKLRSVSQCEIIPVLGSVVQQELLVRLIDTYQIDTIYHCAAYKHVPLVEQNPFEGVRNNIFGTVSVAQAALETGVQRVVLISSDKAVRPTNVMGATKRWAELIMQYYCQQSQTHRSEEAQYTKKNTQFFISVRFGNVLGSNGSVVPLFKEQIASGGPVTVTDVRMTRYFMSISEAAELIIQSGAVIGNGDIALLDMGEPMKIYDLAEHMIILAGLTVRNADHPQGDILIEVTGIRDGEKLYEELFYDPTQAITTCHPKIMCAQQQVAISSKLPEQLIALQQALDAHDELAMRKILFSYIN